MQYTDTLQTHTYQKAEQLEVPLENGTRIISMNKWILIIKIFKFKSSHFKAVYRHVEQEEDQVNLTPSVSGWMRKDLLPK